jgi:predicted nucleotidyltransferase
MLPIRLRDFIEDRDGCLYAVSTYDNADRVGCILRYVPVPDGERSHPSGLRYSKYDFDDAFRYVAEKRPHYIDLIHRVPRSDIHRVFKPEQEMEKILGRDARVRKLNRFLDLKPGTAGCTGSLLCSLEAGSSDIDLVVYGQDWFLAQERLRRLIREGIIEDLDDAMWRRIYGKRKPEIGFEEFFLHEERKWNRGQIDGTYFDLLFTRSYDELSVLPSGQGVVEGKMTIEARVADASLSFDSPAIYVVEHKTISRVLSFTHTYSGQAQAGEEIEACGVCERHGGERWLIIGTTREARGEYIISRTLLDREG